MRAERVLLLDFDGTLCDSSEAIAATMRAALIRLGLGDAAEPCIRDAMGIGAGLEATMGALLAAAGADPARAAEAAACYRAAYPEVGAPRLRAFPGAAEALAELAEGWTLAVVSNKGEAAVLSGLAELRLGDRIAAVAGAIEGQPGKPAPEVYWRRVRPRLAVEDGARLVVVGDTGSDARLAEGLGAAFVFARYGLGRGLEAPWSIGAIGELPALARELSGR